MTNIIVRKGLVNVSLGLLQREHKDLYLPAANENEHVDGTNTQPPYWGEMFDGFLKRLLENRSQEQVFALLYHEGDAEHRAYRYIGHMGIHEMKWPDAVGVSGSIIIDHTLHGKRIGTEAKLLLLYQCFFVLGLRVVKSSVKEWNANSLGHLFACGYEQVGRYKKTIFYRGNFVDEFILQVSRESFEPIWEKYQETKTVPGLTAEQKALVSALSGKSKD